MNKLQTIHYRQRMAPNTYINIKKNDFKHVDYYIFNYKRKNFEHFYNKKN